MVQVSTALVVLFSLALPPLLAVMVTGHDPWPYLNFPFLTPAAPHQVFSRPVWWGMVVLVIAVTIPFAVHALRYPMQPAPTRDKRVFPVWGRVAALLLIPFWVLAWSRFNWFAALQVYTFTPLWLCYIVLVNAISARRKGHCLLTERPRYLFGLSILSSGFWWYYEYLNGFIKNWHYAGVEQLTPAAYVLHSSLAYATVLPAVISTVELLDTLSSLSQPFLEYRSCRPRHPKPWAISGWIGGCTVLGLAAVYPEQLFMCVWIAPLFIITCARQVLGHASLFSSLARCDWRPVVLPALAALVCGVFWELWNSRSYAHWEYSVPYVNAYHLFAMPAIGYAGYLPFGLVCLAVAELIGGTDKLFDA
jgi:hypothetical protein